MLISHRPSGPSHSGRPLALVADIALFVQYDRLVLANQIVSHLRIMYLVFLRSSPCAGNHFWHPHGYAPHPEILVITFLCWIHLWVPLTSFVFCQGRCSD